MYTDIKKLAGDIIWLSDFVSDYFSFETDPDPEDMAVFEEIKKNVSEIMDLVYFKKIVLDGIQKHHRKNLPTDKTPPEAC